MSKQEPLFSWQEILSMTQSDNSSVRKDAVLSANSHVQAVLERIGFTFSTIPGSGDSSLGRRLIEICQSINSPSLPCDNVRAAVKLRNELAHENAHCDPVSCAAAVSAYRHLLCSLAQFILREAEGDFADTEGAAINRKRSGIGLHSYVARIFDQYGIPNSSEDAVRDAIHGLSQVALVGISAAMEELYRSTTNPSPSREAAAQANHIQSAFILPEFAKRRGY